MIRLRCLPLGIGSKLAFGLPACFSAQPLSLLPEAEAEEHFDSDSYAFAFAYAAALQHCVRKADPLLGKSLHCHALKRGACLDLFASNILLNLYAKSRLFPEAQLLLDEMPARNTVSFVTLIQGYALADHFAKALQLLAQLHREGHDLNPFVFTALFKLLASMDRPDLAQTVHACIVKLGHHSNAFVATALIDAYSLHGDVFGARDIFYGITHKDMVSWTGMIACFVENGHFEEALKHFLQMLRDGYKPNNYTFAGVFKACLGLSAVRLGKTLHGCALKTCYELDLYVGVGLLEFYSCFSQMQDAHTLFEELPQKDVIHWSLMISRHAQGDRSREAMELFLRMRDARVIPNQFTLASVLQACSSMESLDLGMQIHCYASKLGLDSNVFVSNALMDVYAKCGSTDVSEQIFEGSEDRNSVSWNTLIVGFVQSGKEEKALDLFSSMLKWQVEATQVTYSSILRACSSLAALDPGNQVHALAIKMTYDKDPVVGNSLINMYAKCGDIKDARLAFDTMDARDGVSWNSMISGYSMHGLSAEALKIFESMKGAKVKPTMMTFVGVLSACSNGGLLETGEAYFNSMVQEHGIEPCMEHYTCMVGLFGRLGHLDRAHKLIQEIPHEPSVMVWRSLLGACVIHHNVELGKLSAEKVLELEPQDEATYVLLSNIYAKARRWDSVAFVRKKMKRNGVKKEPGLSWVEMQGSVTYFTVGETSHPDMKLINGMLEYLNMKTRREGFTANCDAILLQVEEEEKERMLWLHSERLALAFALIKTPNGGPIRIIKNLRICVDCHSAVKIVSRVIQREIVVRDVNRYHHFRNGGCSCGDYW